MLYTEDAVIISRIPIDLRGALRSLTLYCKENRLVMNYHKTKIMTFAKKSKIFSLNFDNHKIEQVTHFKYLGIIFLLRSSKRVLGKRVALNPQRNSSAILQLMCTK